MASRRVVDADRLTDDQKRQLQELYDFAVEGWDYVSQYFKDKWDYEGQRQQAEELLDSLGVGVSDEV